jgi:hypothetical protein
MFDVGGLVDYVDDIELDAADHLYDNGCSVRTHTCNQVGGIKLNFHPSGVIALPGAYCRSTISSNCNLGLGAFPGPTLAAHPEGSRPAVSAVAKTPRPDSGYAAGLFSVYHGGILPR